MQLIGLLLLACDDAPKPHPSRTDTSDRPTWDTSDPDLPASTCGDTLELAVGTGEFAWAPLSDGDELAIVQGPAGGWHAWVAGQVEGGTGVVQVTLTLTWPTGGLTLSDELTATSYVALAAWSPEDCTGAFFGARAYFDSNFDPEMSRQDFICALEGEVLELTVDVVDYGTDLTTSATVTVVAQVDPETNTCD